MLSETGYIRKLPHFLYSLYDPYEYPFCRCRQRTILFRFSRKKKRGCEDFTCFRQHKTNIPLTGNIPVVSRLQKQIISSSFHLFLEICIYYMPGLSVCQTLFRHIFLFFPPHRLVNKRNILYNGFDFYMEKIHSEGPSAERLKMDRESGSLCFHACAISGCAFATVFWWPATVEKCILTVKGGN